MNSFSFRINQNNELTLSNPMKYIYDNKIKHFLGFLKQDINQGHWYYVHFMTNDLSQIKKYIKIQANDQLIKNTFILYLTQNQIEKITNISLIKKIEPQEKYNEEGGSLQTCNELIVFTSNGYQLPNSNDDYIIKHKANDNSYIIKIPNQNLNAKNYYTKKNKVVKYLSEIPEVKAISTYSKPTPANALTTGYTQKNNYEYIKNNNSQFYFLERYINDKGFTGKDQIITILDTPIDFYHAMFRDDNVQVKINTYMPNYRKLIYYGFNGTLEELKNKIEENEHGTHVAGTAAGKSICQNDEDKGTSYFNGNAPDSKILFAGHFNEVQPLELQKLMNNYNSKISSNSWGITSFYNPSNYQFGQLAQKSPNITFIFCAGNEHRENGNFTIRDPSGSKNVLSVGSIDHFYNNILNFNVVSKNDPDLQIKTVGDTKDPWFIGSIGSEPGKADILAVDTNKGEQCSKLTYNKFFLFYGTMFDWIQKCTIDPKANFLITTDSEKIEKLLESKSDIIISRIIEMNWTKRVTQSSYSSTGPANKGILKPDVMAPGTQVISAKSREYSNSPHGCRDDNEGDFTTMDGTSMATPNVAGAAALIHQYFLSGSWIDSVHLDGDTTRALLINSCRHPLDSKSPDTVFGHGVVDLSTILPVEDNFGVQITYQSLSSNETHKPSVEENGHVISKIIVDTNMNNKDLQITLSYVDTMLNMESPIPLTRDIDLIVISPSLKVFYGDHLANGDTQHLSTNEKIIIKNEYLENGEYTIHIYGGNFVDKGLPGTSTRQEFAVVASGPINNGFIEFNDSSECPCEKCDQYHPGNCLCDENLEVGHLCQAKIETLTDKEGAFFLLPLEIKRIRFVSDNVIKYVYSKSKYPGKDTTIWVSKKCHLNLGEYEVNGYTDHDFSFQSKTKVDFGTKEVCVAIFNNNDRETTYTIEISNKTKYNWAGLIILIESIVIFIFIIIFCYICCCNKRTRCCKKKEHIELESVLTNSLQNNLLNN